MPMVSEAEVTGMADVIIKGMEMPENCNECRLLGEGRWCWAIPVDETQPGATREDKRPDWCPLRSAPKWISVEERLPEKTGAYLVWMLWPCDEYPVHSIINFDADCEEFGEWEEYYDHESLGWAGSDFKRIENVYAWMPLPEPPEGGDGDDD